MTDTSDARGGTPSGTGTSPAAAAESGTPLDPAALGIGHGPIVVKVGGGADLDPAPLWDDLAALDAAGIRWVLVHGGNAALTRLQTALGRPPVFVEGPNGAVSRYTDADAIEQMAMVYAGLMNTRHVCALRHRGVNALGLTGVDGGLLTGTRRPQLRGVVDGRKKVLRDDHVGSIDHVNADLVHSLLAMGYAPVITVPAYADGPAEVAGVPINVDGDTAARAIAEAIRATALVYLSDVPALLADLDDATSRIARVRTDAEWRRATEAGQGRMRRKVEGARAAVDAGVATVVIAGANGARPLVAALEGGGTHFGAGPQVQEMTT